MSHDPALVRAPKQQRSRVSFDKALDAAVALLVERRSDAFTLAEVVERAGVSTGSIYGRVGGKDDLIRTAQARELVRIMAEQDAAFAAPAPQGEALAAAVTRVVTTLGEQLRRHAPVLTPFMVMANVHRDVAEAGQAAYGQAVDLFCAALLTRREEIARPDPAQAVAWSFTVVYSVLARWLGLGSDPVVAGEGEWEQIIGDLAAMVTAFLTST